MIYLHLFNSIGTLKLTLFIVVGLIASKFIAALLAKLVYRYNWQEMLTMWSLVMPQVGTTLAATLVGYRAGLLPSEVLNSIIVLMLVTSTLGRLITSRIAVGLTSSSAEDLAANHTLADQNSEDNAIVLLL